MKKLISLSFVLLFALSMIPSRVEAKVKVADVQFCSHGSSGGCSFNGSGWDCNAGGSDCGGTHTVQF